MKISWGYGNFTGVKQPLRNTSFPEPPATTKFCQTSDSQRNGVSDTSQLAKHNYINKTLLIFRGEKTCRSPYRNSTLRIVVTLCPPNTSWNSCCDRSGPAVGFLFWWKAPSFLSQFCVVFDPRLTRATPSAVVTVPVRGRRPTEGLGGGRERPVGGQ